MFRLSTRSSCVRASTALLVLVLAACSSGSERQQSSGSGGTNAQATGGTSQGNGNGSGGTSDNANNGGSVSGSNVGSNESGAGNGSEPAGATAGSGGEGAGGSSSSPPVVIIDDPDCFMEGDDVTTVVLSNGCADALSFAGSDVEGGEIPAGGSVCINAGSASEELPAKRYWGYIGENPGNERHTLAEFTFNTDFNDFDWYNISHVDAHNLTMAIEAIAHPDCDRLVCADSLLASCPEVGKLYDSLGTLISCYSPDRNDPNSEVALYFEQCDDAYAWSLDDANGDDPSPVRACAGEDFRVTFCPQP